MRCDVLWNHLTLPQWQEKFRTVRRSTLLQSYGYAQMMAATQGQKARWGLIMIDGREAGLVQILEAGFFWNAIHAVMLDRGPLWFAGFGGAAHQAAFFQWFQNQFPSRFGRKRRILPEIADGATARALIHQTGLTRKEEESGYHTAWWDCGLSEDKALAAVRPNWRGALMKAGKSVSQAGLTVEWDHDGRFYGFLRKHYAQDKALRGYGGLSPQSLDILTRFSTQKDPILMGRIGDLAAVLFCLHGQSATYQVGWTSSEGRAMNAHHLLLWQARTVLKDYGIQDLDLGGYYEDSAQDGLKRFKEGTGAAPVTLIGHYS